MTSLKYLLVTVLLSQTLISQNYNFYSWQGLSGSTSDNLDAMHLNPAGLGVKRAKISGFSIKEFSDENDNISGNYFVSLATRYPGGFAIENYYDGKFHTSIGYGTTLSTNIYFGASYHTDDNYTVGLLLRPSNVFSIGITKHAQNNSDVKYREVFYQAEKEFSAYNFEYANTDNLFKIFDMLEDETKKMLEKKLSLPAYDQCLKASHVFNLLDSRGVISVAQRAEYISKIRDLTKSVGLVRLETQK